MRTYHFSYSLRIVGAAMLWLPPALIEFDRTLEFFKRDPGFWSKQFDTLRDAVMEILHDGNYQYVNPH